MLRVSENNIGDKGAKLISELIAENSKIESLYLNSKRKHEVHEHLFVCATHKIILVTKEQEV